ncbi:MAG: hypothetical protein A2086_04000 [Spirochaetes bacterium GWD1_27_9]|nr:MAG: hypothetical protein A2Z98_03150 [Spirochaetes bacterium GWB1_27_13]OHD24513.1 MAG: hypothetical protein A2Y34_03525 [Spirochaetes bacterium GWC1_27_15]OHD45137.1 MAG: hypothetical protein A2086_04000 [Spirochaetes bacterium GWD1_27_9]
MGRVIGIDLGTTNSCCAYFDKGRAYIIPDIKGSRITPSIVAFTDKNEVLVGDSAKNQFMINPEKTITGIKRKMGSAEKTLIGKKEFLPQVISSYILSKIKEDAQKYLGEKISSAIITVPAYFSDSQRQATIEAGKLAGLNVLRIINEPTAASLAYGLNTTNNHNIVVYDLGGGTFDVSVLEIENGVFEVKATKGNNKLGGMDFDNRLKDLIIKEFGGDTGIDLSKDKLSIQKLTEEVEEAKKRLSSFEKVEINIPFISATEKGPVHLNFEVTRDMFEALIEDYIDETIQLTKDAILDAKIEIEAVDKIILVGGSTKIPLVRKKIEDCLGKKVFAGINPDEVVAMGAAIQGGIIKGEISGVVLVDVTPLSLGIEIDGGLFIPIIERNSSIPTEATKIFTTISDDQEDVEIHILQGENKDAKDNISLGKFILSGIRKAKKGVPRIEVCFDINVDSIVNVRAKDLDTGETQKITINSNLNLSEDEINILISEKIPHKKNDFNLLRVEARKLVAKIEDILREKTVDCELKNQIEEKIIDINKIIDEKDTDRIEDNIRVLKDFYEELLMLDKNPEEIFAEEFCVIN